MRCLWDSIIIMCDIEIAELSGDDEPESERCKMASGIVTVLGNALAKEEGFYDQQDEDIEEEYYGKA